MDHVVKLLCFILLSHVRRKPGRLPQLKIFYIKESLNDVDPLQQTGDPEFHPQQGRWGKGPEDSQFQRFLLVNSSLKLCPNRNKNSLKGTVFFIILQLASSQRQKKGKCIGNTDNWKPLHVLISSESFKHRVESGPGDQHQFIFTCIKFHDYLIIFPT